MTAVRIYDIGEDLSTFRAANVKRAEVSFGHKLADWSPAEWGCALAGETGELCNLLKKMRRGESINMREVEDEIGDVMAYLDLLAAALNVDLMDVTLRKWNEVSAKRNYPVSFER